VNPPTLRRQIVSLGAARLIDYGLQFALPIAFARLFDPADYGRYRLLWLLVGTTLVFSVLNMPQSLFYFLPHGRSRREKAGWIGNAFGFLAVTGALAAAAVNPWWPLLPERFLVTGSSAWVVPAFVLAWTLGQLLDTLPNAEDRIGWQARAIVGLAFVRAVLLVGVAWVYRDMDRVFLALLAFAGLKLLVLAVYLLRFHPPRAFAPDFRRLTPQLRYAVPFGCAGGLFSLRNQADQWIVAHLFTVRDFAAFTTGITVGPLLSLLRESIINPAVLPRLSRLHAEGQRAALLNLFRRANTATALILFPVLAWFFLCAEAIVGLLFTDAYRDGAAVMRVYLLSFATQTFEVNNLLRVYEGGPFSLRLGAWSFAPALALSYAGALQFGLWGAALGAVGMTWVGELVKLRHAARRAGTSARRVVDWRNWGALLYASLAAGVLAFEGLGVWRPASDLAEAVIGGTVIALVYPLLIVALRPGLLGGFLRLPRWRRPLESGAAGS
jgi:O-antigen/teichoic acid export membrane protein